MGEHWIVHSEPLPENPPLHLAPLLAQLAGQPQSAISS